MVRVFSSILHFSHDQSDFGDELSGWSYCRENTTPTLRCGIANNIEPPYEEAVQKLIDDDTMLDPDQLCLLVDKAAEEEGSVAGTQAYPDGASQVSSKKPKKEASEEQKAVIKLRALQSGRLTSLSVYLLWY